MFTLRLFHTSAPFSQIEARNLGDSDLSLGRDASADWPVDDASRTLSRVHCVFTARGGRLTLRDNSANGVFVGPDRRRIAPRTDAPVAPGETIRLGDYLVVVEGPEPPRAAADGMAPRGAAPDASLMESFCLGAGLDASSFSEEDPALVMGRLGEVYRRMVAGLSDLMGERNQAKSDHQLERTTVRAGGNNPFRWASEERVAVDLLRPRDDFLFGAAAVDSSFNDLQKHLACTASGVREAVAAAVDALAPVRIEEALKSRSFTLKTRSAEAWERYLELHAAVAAQGMDDPQGAAGQAFRDAYERQDEVLSARDGGA